MSRSLAVAPEPLYAFTDAICRALGASAEVAAEVAAHLVRANLSGRDVHGVGRLPAYVALADQGRLDPAARPRLVRRTAVVATVDGGGGFGQAAAAVALDWCVEQAPQLGLAASAVGNCGDVGRVCEYADRAAKAGMLAIVTAGAAGRGAGHVMAQGGRERLFGANPWSFAAAGHERSMTFEASSSTVDETDVRLVRAKGESLPPDCVYDSFGRPSADPDELFGGGTLAPLGGGVAGHKGYGLAFASALFGALAPRDGDAPAGGVFLAVVDPAAFGDADGYRGAVDATLAAVKGSRPAAGHSEVLLPGEPEARSREERTRAGILLPETTWSDLATLGERFGVEPPERR